MTCGVDLDMPNGHHLIWHEVENKMVRSHRKITLREIESNRVDHSYIINYEECFFLSGTAADREWKDDEPMYWELTNE